MKKEFQKIMLLVFLFFEIATLYAQSTYEEAITKDNAKKYLTKLYTDMQAFHPNLYQYFSKKDYDKIYDEIMQTLDTIDFYNPDKLFSVLQEFVFLCRDGHSGVGMNIPPNSSLKKSSKNETTDPLISRFPFIYTILKGKMYVSYHCFGIDAIPIKSEIVSIDKQTIEEWLQKKRAKLSGERKEYRDAKLNTWGYINSKSFYSDSCMFGYILHNSQDTLYKTLSCNTQWNQYKECILNYFGKEGITEDIKILSFRPLDEGRIGIIKMDHFFPVKMMLPFINRALDSLKFYKTTDLIIDLRNSPGGYAESGYALIDRITNKSYRTHSEEQIFIKSAMLTSDNPAAKNIYTCRKYLKKSEMKATMKAGKDTIITYQFPEIKPKEYKNKFTGRIWVLTSAYTFSAAVGLAAIVQDCQLGTVVGEETGGVPNTYGNLLFYPLTGVMDEKILKFYYVAPFVKFIRPSGNDSMYLRGVIPDIEIEPNIILNEDIQLQTLIEIIKKQKNN
jgi:hypothetical protein